MRASSFNLGISRILLYGFCFLYYFAYDFAAWAHVPIVFWRPIALFNQLHWSLGSETLLVAFSVIWKAALALSAVGLATRPATLTAAALGTYLLGLEHNFGKVHHFTAALVIVLWILALSRSGDRCSVDSWISTARSRTRPRNVLNYLWPIWAVRVQLSLVMLAAGLAKLRHGGMEWITSDNLARVLETHGRYQTANLPPLAPDLAVWLSGFPLICSLIAAATVIVETSYPLALFHRYARYLVIPAAIGMLFSFRVLMGPNFWPLMVLHVFWIDWQAVLPPLRSRG